MERTLLMKKSRTNLNNQGLFSFIFTVLELIIYIHDSKIYYRSNLMSGLGSVSYLRSHRWSELKTSSCAWFTLLRVVDRLVEHLRSN